MESIRTEFKVGDVVWVGLWDKCLALDTEEQRASTGIGVATILEIGYDGIHKIQFGLVSSKPEEGTFASCERMELISAAPEPPPTASAADGITSR